LPDWPNEEQSKLYLSFHVSVTVNFGVFSCPDPLNVATVCADGFGGACVCVGVGVGDGASAGAELAMVACGVTEAVDVSAPDDPVAEVAEDCELPPPDAPAAMPMMTNRPRMPRMPVSTLWRAGHGRLLVHGFPPRAAALPRSCLKDAARRAGITQSGGS
jgi:hypothetical protein